MGLKYLLDTNVVSEPPKLTPSRRIIARLHHHALEIAIASVTWHELRFGAAILPPSDRRDKLEHYLAQVLQAMPVLEYGVAAAEWHAAERARLAARGEMPPFQDGQIAAIAAVNDLTLVTSNLRDFRRFDGLRVVSWA